MTIAQILLVFGIYFLLSYLILATLVIIEVEGGAGLVTILKLSFLGIPIAFFKLLYILLKRLAVRRIRKKIGIYTGRIYEYHCFGVDFDKYEFGDIRVYFKVIFARKLSVSESERMAYVNKTKSELEEKK